MKRKWVLLLTITLMLVGTITPSTRAATSNQGESNVITLGGDNDRNHHYISALPRALCRQNELEFGRTLAQPLVVHYPQGVEIDGVRHQDVVFYLGEKNLYLLNLSGELLRTHKVQEYFSTAQMTYVQPNEVANEEEPPSPERDWLYVATHFVTLKVFAVKDLLEADHAKPIDHLSMADFAVVDKDESVVAAPLFLGFDSEGRDVVVISKIPHKLVLVVGLARGGKMPKSIDIGQWNSGTAVRLAQHLFVVGVGGKLTQWRFVEEHGVGNLKAEWEQPLDSQALTRLVRERSGDMIYVAEGQGKIYRFQLSQRIKRKPIPHYNGFINVGPSTDHEQVYFAFRWAGSESSEKAGTDHGFVIALDKQTWKEAWRVNLDTSGSDRSWGNVPPVVWESRADSSQRLLITGDAGGAVSAFTHQGEKAQLFLTAPDLLPQDCTALETRDPQYRPNFEYRPRTFLSHNTRKIDKSSEYVWVNTQGVTTDMTIFQGRLFAGYITQHDYNENNEPWVSSLVIFRPAANIYPGGNDGCPPDRDRDRTAGARCLRAQGGPAGRDRTGHL